MRDFQEFSFLSLIFCKTFKSFCENQILWKLYGSVSVFLEFLELKKNPEKFEGLLKTYATNLFYSGIA